MVPVPFGSHVTTMVAAGKTLLRDGHDVTFLVADNFNDSLTKKGMKTFTYSGTKVKEAQDYASKKAIPLFAQGEVWAGTKILLQTFSSITDTCEMIMQDQHIVNSIMSHKFDLVITEGYAVFSCFNILPYMLNIPFIIFAIQPVSWGAGIPSMPSFEPSPAALPYTSEMTLKERLINLIVSIMGYYSDKGEYLVEMFLPEHEMLSLNDIVHKAEMWLINTESWCLDYPRVSAPHFQFIGSSSAKPVKALPDYLEEFMISAKQGIIVMSYGSSDALRNALKLHIETFFGAFRKVAQKVVLALDCNGLNVPSNVKCVDWMPQNDLLGHSNTVLFITHGGANGQMEAIRHGVPMISIGVMSEQLYNSRRIEYNGYGKQLKLHELTSDDLVQAIHDITSNAMYYENARRCSQIIQEFPPASENVVFWINHILKFGGSRLHPQSVGMPLYKLFMVDVLGVLLLTFCIIILITCYSCWICYKRTITRHTKMTN